TFVTEFLFEGFSSFRWQHKLVFFVTCYTVAIIPHMLSGLLNPRQPIATQSCATKLFFYLTFGINNCFLLTVMGYNCYVAICNPLRYSVFMGKRACIQLASGSLGIGLGMAIVQVTSVFGLSFCDAFVISHFFCDVRPLLKLAGTDTTVNEIINFVVNVCVLVLWAWFLSPMSSSSPPFLRLPQLKVRRRPLPFAPPTSQRSSCTMAVPPSSTCSLSPRVPWDRTDSSQ
uniref:G-protein coupled receptors family 1 profile domain-containing protein n=1 Tax=Nomascus leucogenys TaxID=61853 RepID=G1RS18_NOMLE